MRLWSTVVSQLAKRPRHPGRGVRRIGLGSNRHSPGLSPILSVTYAISVSQSAFSSQPLPTAGIAPRPPVTIVLDLFRVSGVRPASGGPIKPCPLVAVTRSARAQPGLLAQGQAAGLPIQRSYSA